jgi:anti-sigma B factor antagonist
VSNTGRTPAGPGQTQDLGQSFGADEQDNDAMAAEDAVAEQVVDLDVERRADVVIVHIGGEVDMLTTPMVSALITEQLQTAPSTLVLDLSAVGFLGSSGLAALVAAREEAGNRGVTLRLVGSGHAVQRPLTATGLAELFDIYPDLDQALAQG